MRCVSRSAVGSSLASSQIGKIERAVKKWKQCVKSGKGTRWAEKAQAELDALGGAPD